jgi:hypothetical protein
MATNATAADTTKQHRIVAAPLPLRHEHGKPMNHPNRLLHQARLRLPSPSGSSRPMSRQELAEAVNAYLFTHTKRVYTLDAHYIGRLERGARRWPNADYRQGFRAILGAQSDAELGFSRTQRSGNELAEGDTPPEPMVYSTAPTRLVVNPSMAVILVPADHPVLLALVDGQSNE